MLREQGVPVVMWTAVDVTYARLSRRRCREQDRCRPRQTFNQRAGSLRVEMFGHLDTDREVIARTVVPFGQVGPFELVEVDEQTVFGGVAVDTEHFGAE